MFKHLYQNPPAAIAFAEGNEVNDSDLKEAIKHFEQFYEEIFVELSDFGELKELSVVDNLSDHLIGNVYAKFNDEESASKAYNALEGKYYHSNMVEEEYCPIINVKDCKCRKFEDGLCNRGPYCNFIHLKEVSKSLLRSLRDEMYETHPEYKKNRNNNNNFTRKKPRRHENTSSESSLDRYDNFTRKRIIQRWNDDFKSEKNIQDKRKKIEKERYEEKKEYERKKYAEDFKREDYKRNKREKEKDEYRDKERDRDRDKDKRSEKDNEEIKRKEEDKKEEKNIDSDDEETISRGEVE